MAPVDTMTIVEATLADAPAIAALHAASWRSAYRGMLPDAFLDGPIEGNRLEHWTHRMSLASPRRYVLSAVTHGRLFGCACVFAAADPEWGALLDNLHVAPDAKGRGIGARLLGGALEWVRATSRDDRMHLWVFDANEPARRFYDRQGGRVTGARTAEIIPGTQVAELRYAWETVVVDRRST